MAGSLEAKALAIGDRYPGHRRVTLRRDFLRIQRAGHRATGPHYVAIVQRRPATGPTGTRLGITVSRKVGNAVERNRIKRWVRECFRRNQKDVPVGADLVMVARPGAGALDYHATHDELLGLWHNLSQRRGAR